MTCRKCVSILLLTILLGIVVPVVSLVSGTDENTALAAPVTDYEVSVVSTSSVYVDQGAPDVNLNTIDKSYLRVGRSTEFCYYYHTLIKFSPIAEANGGPLPDGAEITGAGVRLYKTNTVTGTVNIYKLAGSFGESTVTWNTKPALSTKAGNPVLLGSMTLPPYAGWYTIDIPISTVESWVTVPSYNFGLAIQPSWTNCKNMAFGSDESSFKPSLVITYTGAEPPPEPPPSPPEDDIPCELTYTVTPSSPSPGDTVTVTARATDNQGLSYVSIQRGYTELATVEAAGDSVTELEVSYSETAELPGMNYAIVADDLADPPPVRYDIVVPVSGTGTTPVVEITADWVITEVFPARYRLIENDGQSVTLTATATDPDGIDHMTIFVNGSPHDYSYSGETSISETITWANNVPGLTRFYFSANARDREGMTGAAPGESYNINHLEDIALLWNAAPGFRNPTADRLSWERMVQTFGADECWWWEERDWKNPYALIWYHAGFKDIARAGNCFGMATTAAEIYQGRITARDLESPLMASELDYANSYTREYVQCRQAGQLGVKVVAEFLDQYVEWAAEVGAHLRKLGWIERDLERDEPGIICIRNDAGGGHAILPWMTRHMPDGTTRVYVYDSNFALDNPTPDGIHNPSADFNDRHQFPYMEFSFGSWGHVMGAMVNSAATSWVDTIVDGSTWDSELYYFAYDMARGDRLQDHRVGPPGAPSVGDHDLPNIIDAIIAIFSGDADVYVEDEMGNITGIRGGTLLQDIPGSMALPLMAADAFEDYEMFVLPPDSLLTFHVTGNVDADYTLGLMGGGSAYSIEEKSIAPGAEDRLVIAPSADAVGHAVSLILDEGDDDFTMRLAHMFGGSSEALDKDFIGREYILESISAAKGGAFTTYTEDGGDGLVIISEDGDIELDVTLRSTESADYIDPADDADYIPGSTIEDLVLESGEKITATPESWTTTEEHGTLHSLGKREPADTETPEPAAVPPGENTPTGPTTIAEEAAITTPTPTETIAEENTTADDGSNLPLIIIAAAAAVIIAVAATVLIMRRGGKKG